MEIIAELNHATDNQRLDFIVEYNHNQGYKVTEEIDDTIPSEDEDYDETVIYYNLKAYAYTDEEKAEKREADFNKAFFNSSLGYVRREVTMADGGKKDFLSDLLPVISMGVQSGVPVNILTYDKPPFDEDVTDWTEYQHQVVVTPQFIQECFLQLSNDFLPININEQ